jgi:hypothetical protein
MTITYTLADVEGDTDLLAVRSTRACRRSGQQTFDQLFIWLRSRISERLHCGFLHGGRDDEFIFYIFYAKESKTRGKSFERPET